MSDDGTPTCDVDVMGCEQSAEYRAVMDGSHAPDLFDRLERLTCSAHRAWYRREYGDRGYTLEFGEL